MKSPAARHLAAILCLGFSSFCPAADKPSALEPVCADLEPVTLRTALARPLSDSKQTVIIPAREDNVLGLSQLSKEEFTAAGLDWDKFMAQATAAATRLLVSLKPEITAGKDGAPAYATLRSDRPFTASVVLSPRLIPLFKEQFGDRLVVLMPDRFTVYLFSRNFGNFQEFGQRILKEHSEAVYPCSIEAFEVSQEGLKCLGSFDTGEKSVPPTALKPATNTNPAPADKKPAAVRKNSSKPK